MKCPAFLSIVACFSWQAWLGEINEYAQDDVVIMLLGNKADCAGERVIRQEDGEKLAKVTPQSLKF